MFLWTLLTRSSDLILFANTLKPLTLLPATITVSNSLKHNINLTFPTANYLPNIIQNLPCQPIFIDEVMTSFDSSLASDLALEMISPDSLA